MRFSDASRAAVNQDNVETMAAVSASIAVRLNSAVSASIAVRLNSAVSASIAVRLNTASSADCAAEDLRELHAGS